jgi:hypothetical protein
MLGLPVQTRWQTVMSRDELRTATQADYRRFSLPKNQHPAASLYPPMGNGD